MTKRMIMDATHASETRVAILDEDTIEHFDFISTAKRQMKGNIYLGKITRIEPSLQAAFVEYGGGKQGFLSFSEIHPDYYQIPVADRQRLIEEAARAAEQAERDEEAEIESEARNEARGEDHEERPEGRRDGRRNRTRLPRRERSEESAEAGEGYEHTEAMEQQDSLDGDVSTREMGTENESPVEIKQPDIHMETGTTEDSAEPATESESAEAETSGEPSPAPRSRRRPYSRKPKQARSQRSELETSSENIDDSHEEHEEHTVETVSEEDAEHAVRKPRQTFSRRYKIQEVIKPNQIVLVQVVKEERGNKGCSLSTYISLPGRYCVLMPNSPKDGGISRKIGSNVDRKRLKEIAAELRESRGMSAIIRTAGIDRTKTEIKRDYEYLIKLWNQTRDLALSSTAPALVYEEGNIVKRTIRDYYNGDMDEILVQGENAYKAAKDFMKMIMPSHAARVKQFKEAQPVFHAYGVEEQLAELYHPIAPLPSGGYLVINPTEALISIDVNSGRSTTERNVEETAFKTNIEAAEEVARQLRLRDLGGLVVIDFIDMGYGKHRRAVEKAVKDALKSDRAKVQVGHISAFGLMELSRQRLGPSLFEATTIACPHCKGNGNVRSPESTAMAMIRELESEAFETGAGEYRIRLSARDAIGVMNHYRGQIAEIEARYGLTVIFEIDPEMTDGTFTLDNGKGGGSHARRNQDTRPQRRRRGGRNRNGRTERGPATSRPLLTSDEADHAGEHEEVEEQEEATEREPREGEASGEEGSEREGGRRRRSRRGRRGGGRARQAREGEERPQAEDESDNDYRKRIETAETAEPAEPNAEVAELADASPQTERRPRGARGGRGRPRREDGGKPEMPAATDGEPAPARPVPEPRMTEARQENPAPAERQPSFAAPAAANLHAPIEKPNASDEPKRKGWWSKITG